MDFAVATMHLLQRLAGSRVVRRAAHVALNRYAYRRVTALDAMDVAAVQARTLQRLIRKAMDTRFGRDHGFDRIRTVADFQDRVPLRDYEGFWQTYWQPAYPHIAGVTWPDTVPYFALSSGTTSGVTKYLPISRAMLHSNRRAALTTLALFLHACPNTPLFAGQLFFLGGSTDLRPTNGPGSPLAGDLSGIAAREVSDVLRPFTFPPVELALLGDWDAKLNQLVETASRLPITSLSGVPAWLLVLFERLRSQTGLETAAEAWPTLEVIVHGGTKFDPYRPLFERVVGGRVKYQEVYPCSEGFIAAEDPRHRLLRVLPDHGIVFEFVPVEELKRDRPRRHTLANVEPGVNYAVAVTTCAGLWAYLLGDTVRFIRRNPPLIEFTGRTKYFLSAFGEHLISAEVERAVAEAGRRAGGEVVDFHVGPVFPASAAEPGHHRYFVEFARRPSNIEAFGRALDEALGQINEDYAAHRAGNLCMGPPEIVVVPAGGFADWMRMKGKAGGQHKVPRMDNSGAVTSELATVFGR